MSALVSGLLLVFWRGFVFRRARKGYLCCHQSAHSMDNLLISRRGKREFGKQEYYPDRKTADIQGVSSMGVDFPISQPGNDLQRPG
jgi:hypothetical protein